MNNAMNEPSNRAVNEAVKETERGRVNEIMNEAKKIEKTNK